MSEKHTPGPWQIIGGRMPENISIVSPDGYVVFGLADRAGRQDNRGSVRAPDDDTQYANARLIAAAPDLLAACDEADTAFAVINIGSENLTPQARAAYRDAWAAVNRAMSLATGRQDKFAAANA